MSSDAVTVFFSYSHKDETLRDELAKHLEILKWNDVIADWHDRRILPGDEWDKQIKGNLNSAQIILLLVSSDFIASHYCRETEIRRAMERHEAGEARVIPVILRKCLWHVTPFGKLQALPKNGTPVMDVGTWPTWDDAFCNIAEGIQKAANSFSQQAESAPVQTVSAVPVTVAASNTQDQYRKRVQEYLVDRQLTVFHEARLELLRKQLKLPEAEAQRILSEELAPIEQAREAYRSALSRLIETGCYPLDEKTQGDLNLFRQELQLSDSEVAEIERPILETASEAAAAAEYKLEVSGSECGIDHMKLRDLLEAGDYKAAAQETYEVMIRAVGKKPDDYFTSDELLNFPCKDLLAIDRLWVKYSQGRFGFSVQKKIYVECGAKLDCKYPGEKIFQAFGDRVGWRVNGSWISYTDVTFGTSAPTGHLPWVYRGDGDSFGIFDSWGSEYLFSYRDL
ncbi:GUN4 domain-containing protein [Leptolyngbya sp. BC1307]|uniref:GUN4 domain-containing protein n=1 Tax=Leptolyngbya sp. BC1307 TaxID=2029589 RepID=UPI00197F1AD5|nr:GUN4 domain-containing protein [Leptolyngbya sp. BC1307]